MTIPEHIMARAATVADTWQHPMHHDYQILQEDVALVILAAVQEERAAIIALAEGERIAWASAEYFGGFNDACNTLAEAIRNRSVTEE